MGVCAFHALTLLVGQQEGVHVSRAPSLERELIERCVGRAPSVSK